MPEAGVNLIYIRDFLAHASVTTTEVYAKANPEMKRKAIEDADAMVLSESRYSAGEKHDLESSLRNLLLNISALCEALCGI